MLVDKFFDNTFNLDSEKQKIINYIKMKKEQSSSEAVFYDKYFEIQNCIGEKFKINTLKNKVWNESDITNLKPKVILVNTKEQLDDWRYLIRFTSSFKNVSNPGRNMKFLVVDETTNKYLGALTVTSDFGDLGARDRYIGWTRDNRFKNKKLNNVACAQAIIPIQPFGILLYCEHVPYKDVVDIPTNISPYLSSQDFLITSEVIINAISLPPRKLYPNG